MFSRTERCISRASARSAGDVHDARSDRVGWMAEGHRLRRRRAARRRSGGRAGEDVEQLVLALALERHDAQHLARVQVERDVLQLRPALRLARRDPRRRVGRRAAAAARRRRGSPASARRSGRASARRSAPRSPAVTSTTPTVSPSRSTVARSQTAAISIIRCEMKMTRAVAATLAADDLEHALGQVRRAGPRSSRRASARRARWPARGRGR